MTKPQHTRNRIENELFDCSGHGSMKDIFFDIEDNDAHYYPRYRKISLSLNHDKKISAHFEYFVCHFDPSGRHRIFEKKKKNIY